MTIQKRPSSKKAEDSKAVEAFIGSAPDSSKPARKPPFTRGNRVQISHTLPPQLLALVDEFAESRGNTRAGIINLALSEFLSTQTKAN